jgi:hypothetical protein
VSLQQLARAILVLCFAWAATLAQQPAVLLDGNPETSGISPAPRSVIAGELLTIAIAVENARSVHSYSVKIAFDPRIVRFEGAVARLAPLAPVFLESNGGRMAAFLPVAGDSMVEIAATQSGNDPLLAASGSGIIGYLHFTGRCHGNPAIRATEALLVDGGGTIESALIH